MKIDMHTNNVDDILTTMEEKFNKLSSLEKMFFTRALLIIVNNSLVDVEKYFKRDYQLTNEELNDVLSQMDTYIKTKYAIGFFEGTHDD